MKTLLENYLESVTEIGSLRRRFNSIKESYKNKKRRIKSRISETKSKRNDLLKKLDYDLCKNSNGGHSFKKEGYTDSRDGRDYDQEVCTKCGMIK